MKRRAILSSALLGASLTLACQTGPAAGAEPTDLTSLEQFHRLFNAQQGKPRLVLLLSPT